jgi:holo-[acyl-carrier protein] synthase
MKALGVGWGAHAGWLEIEVVRAASGRPQLVLVGKAAEYAAAVGVTTFHLALTHTVELALAQVVLEG